MSKWDVKELAVEDKRSSLKKQKTTKKLHRERQNLRLISQAYGQPLGPLIEDTQLEELLI